MLEIQGLTKKFEEKIAVNQLHVTLQEGEVLGLLGRNGAGKTTTIKMLLNLIPKTSGEITWNGKPLTRKHVTIGYLPEERGLYPKTKIKDQLAYFGKLEGMSKKEIVIQMDYWLEKFGISEHKNKLASELSKGNQQKVQIISTLLHNPDLIILDEPFSGLDPVNANLLSTIIAELMEKKKTIILSSHQMNQVEKFAQSICLMKNGEAIAQGSLNQLKKEYGFRNLILEKTNVMESYLTEKGYLFTTDGKEIRLRIKEDAEALTILHELHQRTIPLEQFSLLEPTLHDIFVERMG